PPRRRGPKHALIHAFLLARPIGLPKRRPNAGIDRPSASNFLDFLVPLPANNEPFATETSSNSFIRLLVSPVRAFILARATKLSDVPSQSVEILPCLRLP